MNVSTAQGRGSGVEVVLERPDDFEAWRDRARQLVAAGAAPETTTWRLRGQGTSDLFADPSEAPRAPDKDGAAVRATRAFVDAARSAVLHSDAERFSVLYRLLWRLQSRPRIMDDPVDADVRRVALWVRHVRRDIHKMRAFVRFRQAQDPDGEDRYVAWFEPDHHIVRANAPFFLDRFAAQRWSILTPALCIHWDGEALSESEGAKRDDAPADDASEDLWRRYYASIFNPARLKVGTMTREMPRRYWRNLPEAALIPQLIAGAQAREAAMVDRGAERFEIAPPQSLAEIAAGIGACRRCAIGCTGVRATPGEGPADAALMIVGEQPGDEEEKAGRPFIGPAGQLLDAHLARAGLPRERIHITNAVKHFKFVDQSKRRLHRNPSAAEIDICRWWLDAERRLVRPKMILALGASAGRAILGRTPSIGRERGAPVRLKDGTILWLTVHPSFVLRFSGQLREAEEARFHHDLMTMRTAWDHMNRIDARTGGPLDAAPAAGHS